MANAGGKRVQGADYAAVMADLNQPGQRGKSPLDRLASRFTVGRFDECWPASGGANQSGHVPIDIKGYRTTYAHQITYLVHQGAIPEGAVIRHDCDNPRCCNPAHLRCGTQQDNMQDASTRGRLSACQPRRKVLTADIVRECRRRHAQGERANKLAREFGVNRVTMQSAINGVYWRHVTQEEPTT
jgi:hypothetical protein